MGDLSEKRSTPGQKGAEIYKGIVAHPRRAGGAVLNFLRD